MPFTPGRADSGQELTDTDSFSPLEPRINGFRNCVNAACKGSTPHTLMDEAHLLNLSAPAMTALVVGLRVPGANADGVRARRVHPVAGHLER